MELKKVYYALNHLRKREKFQLPARLSNYLQENKLITSIPEIDYKNYYANSKESNNLERQIDKLSEEKADILDERNNLKDDLSSFLYNLFHSNNTLTDQKEKLSKLEKNLTSLENNIESKIKEREKSERIIRKLDIKYVFYHDFDSRNHVKIGKNYVSLTQNAEEILPIIKKTLKKTPKISYNLFQKNLKKMIRKMNRENYQTSTYKSSEKNYSEREDDDTDLFSISLGGLSTGIGGGGLSIGMGGGSGGGGFSGGGGLSGGGGASGEW